MKKNILLVLLLISFYIPKAFAQVYGNEWINYTQQYFKFKVAKDNIYRINIAALTAVGLPTNVQGYQLQLFKDGIEVPIFVSTSASLSSTDYLEFYGESATGKKDLPLYQFTQLQLNPDLNLISDTSFYFLTYNTLNTNKRYAERINNLSSAPAKEEYFWNKLRINYRNEFFSGPSALEGNLASGARYELNNSQYENEGFVKKTSTLKDSITINCPNAYKTSGAPNSTLKTAVIGKSYFNHNLKIHINNNLVADSNFGFFETKRYNADMPMSWLAANNNAIIRYTPSGATSDRYGVSYVELRYPSTFNFQAKTSFYFELNPKASDYYMEISNFNNASVSPWLYDIDKQEYLIGNISQSGLIRFLIPSSTTVKRFVLQGQHATAINSVVGLAAVNFKNFTSANNQGNYLIITHPDYANDGGNDYISAYKNYRASIDGGSFQPNIAYVEDIYNEFGYGYDYSTLALKNYIQFAFSSTQWPNKPKHVFLIGKGIDYNYYANYQNAAAGVYPYKLVPSFGEPSTDLLLTDFGKNNRPLISIGRLTCFRGNDVRDYLQKVQDHEEVLRNTTQTVSEKYWQKRFLHIAGTSDAAEQLPIVNALNGHKNRISSPFFGGEVTLLKKGSTQEVETINSKTIDTLINTGLSFIQFFGHSSSSGIDYGLDFPEKYTNYKKYYYFMANGCSAGDVFILTPLKLLSERFVLAPNRGAIGFIANVNTSFSGDLGIYTDDFYNHLSTVSYGMTIGEQMQRNAFTLMSNPSKESDPLFRMHTQQIQLNGDPAVKIYNYEKPDYVIEEKDVKFDQLNLTTTLDTLVLNFKVFNIGRHITDSVRLIVKRRLPDNTEFTILNQKLASFSNGSAFQVKMPTYGSAAAGINYLEFEIDADLAIDETSETNNKIVYAFNLYNDDLVPLYPYDFSIVSQQGVTLKGSTLNPYADLRNYIIQIDTTEKFNSTQILTKIIPSKGGVIQWQPPITLKDSTVYYWRMAMDTSANHGAHRWTGYSFIFLNQNAPGWNQSHVYQWQKNNYLDMYADSASHKLKFYGSMRTISVQNVGMNGTPSLYDFGDYFVKLNGITLYSHGCSPSGYGNFQFIVIDSATGKLWQNYRPDTNIALGRFGSNAPCRSSGSDKLKVDPFFEFSFKSVSSRKKIIDFLDSIPTGNYVLMMPRLCLGGACGIRNIYFVDSLKKDTLLYGAGNSLYHKIKNLGFTLIDSFVKNRPMAFWAQKNRPQTVQQLIGVDTTVKLNANFNFNILLFEGNMKSTRIGPAKEWTNLVKIGYSNDPTAADSTVYSIFGIEPNGTETWLTNVKGDTSLQFIDAQTYPYIRMMVVNKDNLYQTPEQLRYWRVYYTPVPEAALNPALYSVLKDTVNQGELNNFTLALENLTPYPMDSMLVKYSIIDKNSNRIELPYQRLRKMVGLDTLNLNYSIQSSLYPGRNTIIVEANPNNDQPEQFHPNNIAIRSFYVVPDKQNPIVDVTFDGVHILDKDIVSAKPFIQIMLKDENKFLALDDTSLIDVFMKYPNDFANEVRIPFDNNILKFFPASASNLEKKNMARIEFRPIFTVDGDDYVLIVKARDKTGNSIGANAYKVGFEVINQPSITAVLNYPNPFTTSTQFVFTLTGSQVPTNMKIQILAVTGKVVREILQSELGPLHMGRNITDYKWPGDDQYGKPLGNGVYLYRVVSNLHGNKMELRKSDADKWMENGYGKLYIMR